MRWNRVSLLLIPPVMAALLLPGVVRAGARLGSSTPTPTATPPACPTPTPRPTATVSSPAHRSVAPGPTATSISPQATLDCQLGAQYEQGGQIDQARQAYATAVAFDPSYRAAVTGLLRVSAPPPLPAGTVSALIALHNSPFAKARALDELHKYAEARAELERVVQSNPALPIPPDLTDLNGGSPRTPVEWWELRAFPLATPPVGEALLIFIVVLLVLLGLLFRIGMFRHVRQTQLKAADFETASIDASSPGDTGSSGSSSPGRAWGRELAYMVGEKLNRFSEQGGGTAPHQVSGDITPSSLQAVFSNAPSQLAILQFLSKVSAWALPPDILDLSGTVHYFPEQGAGLTLSLTESWTGKIQDSVTIWQTDFGLPVGEPLPSPPDNSGAKPAAAESGAHSIDLGAIVCKLAQAIGIVKQGPRKGAPAGDAGSAATGTAQGAGANTPGTATTKAAPPADQGPGASPASTAGAVDRSVYFLLLAEPVSIWLRFALGRYVRGEFEALGTEDWKSYALLRAGVYWATQQDTVGSAKYHDRARRMYVNALTEDSCNRGAWLNLGAMDLETAARLAYEASKAEKKKKANQPQDLAEQATTMYRQAEEELQTAQRLAALVGCIPLRATQREAAQKQGSSKKQSPTEPEKAEHEQEAERQAGSICIDLVWYKATFQRAAAVDYQGKPIEARPFAKRLVDTIEATTRFLQLGLTGGPVPELMSSGEGLEVLSRTEAVEVLTFVRSMRNMAIILDYSIRVELAQAAELCNLRKSLEQELGLDDSPAHQDRSPLSYREHYSLACFYSVLAGKAQANKDDYFEDSLYHLRVGLETGGTIVGWAKVDPSLKSVRDTYKDAFDRVICEAETEVMT